MSKRIRHLMIGTDAMDCYVRLAIDLDVMTQEQATEINNFFVDARHRLARANGDVIVAVAMLAAPILIHALISGHNKAGALNVLDSQDEGWPEQTGINLVEWEVPEIDSESVDVFEDGIAHPDAKGKLEAAHRAQAGGR